MLRVSRSLIYGLCASGLIAHHRCGLGRGTIRIDEKALQDYLKQQPSDPAALMRLAALQERDGAVDDAITTYEKTMCVDRT